MGLTIFKTELVITGEEDVLDLKILCLLWEDTSKHPLALGVFPCLGTEGQDHWDTLGMHLQCPFHAPKECSKLKTLCRWERLPCPASQSNRLSRTALFPLRQYIREKWDNCIFVKKNGIKILPCLAQGKEFFWQVNKISLVSPLSSIIKVKAGRVTSLDSPGDCISPWFLKKQREAKTGGSLYIEMHGRQAAKTSPQLWRFSLSVRSWQQHRNGDFTLSLQPCPAICGQVAQAGPDIVLRHFWERSIS